MPPHACLLMPSLRRSGCRSTRRGEDFCACGAALRGIGRVCDGVPEVRASRLLCCSRYLDPQHRLHLLQQALHRTAWPCCCSQLPNHPARVQVRRAARDELRKGAHCIKVMASGGVASPTDRCWGSGWLALHLSSIEQYDGRPPGGPHSRCCGSVLARMLSLPCHSERGTQWQL